MGTHHVVLLSMLPPWAAVALVHISDSITLQNAAAVASIAYCVVGVYVMLRKKK